MSLLILDVSQWQSPSDYSLTGVSALIAQATIGTTPRANYPAHIAKAKAASIPGCAYHFNYSPVSVADQVAAFLRAAPNADGYALDRENDNYTTASGSKVSIPMFTPAQCREFISRMHSAGKPCGLYASESAFLDAGQDWDWVANYSNEPRIHYDLWQYGPYKGIDASRYDGTAAQLRALLGAKSMPIITVSVLPYGGGVATFQPNASVTGMVIDPATGAITKRIPFVAGASGSMAHYDARVDLSQLGIRGAPFVRIVDGPLTGSYLGGAGGMVFTDNPAPAPVVVSTADTTPFAQADIDAAVAAQAQADAAMLADQVATAKNDAARAERERIAAAEAARIQSI